MAKFLIPISLSSDEWLDQKYSIHIFVCCSETKPRQTNRTILLPQNLKENIPLNMSLDQQFVARSS